VLGVASFWGKQNNTHIVAPKDTIRIGITLFVNRLDSLGVGKYVDLKELHKNLKIVYKIDNRESDLIHLAIPQINVQYSDSITYLYNANWYDS